jgi:hypothetical protein
MTVEEFTRRLRADAVSQLAWVTTLARMLPPVFLAYLDERAARLESMIRQYDDDLAKGGHETASDDQGPTRDPRS